MAVVIDRFNEIVENHASFVALVSRITSESISIFTILCNFDQFILFSTIYLLRTIDIRMPR